MNVQFKTDRLRQCYESLREGTREWGAKAARVYVLRVNQLFGATDAQALRSLRSLRLHALGGARKGQHAIWIDEFYRLIVKFQDKATTVVRIEEVSKHYDD